MSDTVPGTALQRERARETFYDEAEAFTPFLGASTSGGLFVVRTRDKNVGRSLFIKKARGEMRVLSRAVNTLEVLYGHEAVLGKQFVDVGANIGTTTVPALLHHGFATALAVEAEAENFATLRLNALLNGLEGRLVAVHKAASNRVGSAELVVNPAQGGKHRVVSDSTTARVRKHEELVRVETTTLDQLAEEGLFDPARTGLLWIDAQAHEGQIVDGAGCLTSRGVPILLEWDPAFLDKQGDRGTLHEVAERCYSHFAAMRADLAGEGPKFWLRPVEDLHDYSEQLLHWSSRQKLTDLMLVRLTEDELPGEPDAGRIDLTAALSRYTHDHAGPEEPPRGSRRRWPRLLRRASKP